MAFHSSLINLWSFDLLSEIALYATWPTLISMSHWPAPAPVVAEREKRNRIFDQLVTYFPRQALAELFSLLSECEGAIFGPVVWEILNGKLGSLDPKEPAAPLDVVVRAGMNDPFNPFLAGIGFESSTQAPSAEYEGVVETMEVYTMVVNLRVRRYPCSSCAHSMINSVLRTPQSIGVRVWVSKARALSVILASSSTIHMNAITPKTVVSLYPRVTFANEGLLLQGRCVEDVQEAITTTAK